MDSEIRWDSGLPELVKRPKPKPPRPCKNGNGDCPARWTCDACSAEQNRRAMRRLTPKQLAYDSWVMGGCRSNDGQ